VIVQGACYRNIGEPGMKWISELEEYEATTAHIEGILEETTTIFVQTAIFGCMLAYDPTMGFRLAENNCQFLSLDTKENYEGNIMTKPAQTWLLASNITTHECSWSTSSAYWLHVQVLCTS
jgi:hypothetical protein